MKAELEKGMRSIKFQDRDKNEKMTLLVGGRS